ncbi:YvaD family protein [Chloroflexi bacterium TSY]|nr:YvaD family protein [Chloroflexi bacterium TSY]
MKALLTVTEIGMILYWIFATLVVLKLINVSPELMYSDYQNPVIVSWNWSFFPVDILFALTGLVARYVSMSIQRQQLLSAVSLSLMFCAGLMAISFWLLQQSFDPIWWGVNLWLMLLSSVELVRTYLRLP